MKTVVHISADYPDAFAPNKTAAVANLIACSPGFRHVVYSLNRIDGLFGIHGMEFARDQVSLIYRAPPKGLLLRTRLNGVAEWILADLRSRGIEPNLVHAHKFTIEGLVALRLKETLRCPVICNIQGNTDTYIAARRLDVRSTYRELASACERILSFAPWSGPAMQRILGTPLTFEVLPVGTTCDSLLVPRASGEARLVSMFHLDSWRGKGADTLAAAAAVVAADRPGLVLDIYGGGSEKQHKALTSAIRDRAPAGLVRLLGPLPRDRLQQTLNGYSAFVMPSLHETYGLVFVEAIFSGTPVVFPRGRAIDGILPESVIGAGCEPSSIGDLAQAIHHVLDNESRLKRRIATAQLSGELDHLRREGIGARYRKILEDSAA